MLRTDYLPRICAPGVVNDVFTNGRKAFEVGATPTDVPTMPIEFSVAAFRLGHTMIRAAYNWNRVFDDGGGHARLAVHLLRRPAATSAASQRLPSNWIADFRRLYDFGEAGRADLAVPGGEVQPRDADRHDARRTRCGTCRRAFGGRRRRRRANLAFRNLTRARMVQLATGQQMAHVPEEQGRRR